MNISNINSIAGLASGGGAYAPQPLANALLAATATSSANGTTAVAKLADGATITTVRSNTGGIVAVTTVTPPLSAPNPTLPQNAQATFDITA